MKFVPRTRAEYCLGFAFYGDFWAGVLKTDRPKIGMSGWNGIGGKIDAGESPSAAMDRECIEEAGVKLEWKPAGIVEGGGWRVHVFGAFWLYPKANLPSTNDVQEELEWMRTDLSDRCKYFASLSYLIPLVRTGNWFYVRESASF